jgi:hypothetical protein
MLLTGRRILAACGGFAWLTLLLGGCERIEPRVQGPDLAEGALLLSCEGCHTDRAHLRRLALALPDEGGGGGG